MGYRLLTQLQKRNRADDDDDDYFYEDFATGRSIIITEVDEKEPEPTGLLDSRGIPILRIPYEKPPIGFVCPPEFQYLFQTDPETDYYYSNEISE